MLIRTKSAKSLTAVIALTSAFMLGVAMVPAVAGKGGGGGNHHESGGTKSEGTASHKESKPQLGVVSKGKGHAEKETRRERKEKKHEKKKEKKREKYCQAHPEKCHGGTTTTKGGGATKGGGTITTTTPGGTVGGGTTGGGTTTTPGGTTMGGGTTTPKLGDPGYSAPVAAPDGSTAQRRR